MAVRPGQIAFMPAGSIDLTLRGRDAYSIGPQGQLIPRQPEAGMRRITPASGITASTAPTPGFGDVIARQAAARLEAANRMRAAQAGRAAPAAPAAPTIGQRLGTAFRQPLTSPTGMGIMSAALTGLEQAGPQPVPTSTGQILARMGAAGLQAYSQAEKARQAREAAEAKARQDEEYRQQMLQLKKEEISATTEAARIKASGDASTKQVEREMTRAKDFRAASKDFDAANLNYGRIVANATAPNPTGATDIAMIFNFMKMLDPTSVVRGSEYEAAAGAGSLLRSLGVQYNRLFNNEDEKLAPEVRRAFLQTAAETFEPYIDAQELVEDDFRTEAKSQGLRSDRVISRSRIPQRGTKDFPYIAYSQQEADNYPKGSFVMMSGVIGQVK